MDFLPQFFQNGRHALFLSMMVMGLAAYAVKRAVAAVIAVRSRA